MGTGATYAIVTFLVGVIFLLGWAYATASNPRGGAMLRRSFLVFALPILFVPIQWITPSMWVLVAYEEGLKWFGSTFEQNDFNKFWLVSLFGIWELTLYKPFIALYYSDQNLDRLAIAGLVYVTALPVLMHAVTAAIYAFEFVRKRWLAFLASWAIHFTFNETVTHIRETPIAAAIETVVLAIILAGIVIRQRQLAKASSS
ncbi:MAG: hypothetical protein ABGW87_03385 [Sphingomonadaceae bacterium]